MGDYENDTVNFNTEEAKVAKEVATQFVAKRAGCPLKKVRKETEVMLMSIQDIEPNKQSEALLNLVKGMTITEENGLFTCLRISEHVFKGEMSWGRIVTFFMFIGFMMDHAKRTGYNLPQEKVAYWLGLCIAKKSQWIRENGNGWQGFIRTMGGPRDFQESFFNGLFNVTIGLGSLAAAIYIQGR